jgi:uncharacterized protein (TIGR02118 family)
MPYFVVTYANAADSRFNFDYYRNTHLPLADRLLGDYGLLNTEVEKGLPNSRGDRPDYLCITRLYFSDTERMNAGFLAHGAELKSDIANYTNAEPIFTLVEKLV